MSEPRLPVEVEPWSDGRWSRVEREMFEKLDASSSMAAPNPRPAVRRRVLIAGLAAAAVIALVVVLRPAGLLGSSDRLRVATTDSPSSVTVGESLLVVAKQSLVLVSGDDERGIDVVLDRGGVTCEVAPRKGHPPFVVDAGDARVRVVGTRFTVVRDALATSVSVDHGVVEVSAGGKVTVLHDGDRWPEVGVSAGVNAGAGGAGVNAGAGAGAGVNAGAGVSPGADPGAPVPAVHPHVKPVQSPSAVATTSRPATTDVGAGPSSAPAAAPVQAPAGPSPQESYELAARIEKSRPDDAAAIYRQLAAGGTGWASSALFALARLEADRGHRESAQRLLEDYLARYPRGLNADDARGLLQRMR